MANRFWGQLADAFIPGNAYNEHLGRWNRNTTKAGIAGLIADVAGVPGGSQAITGMAKNGMFGQGMADGMFREYIADGMSPSYANTIADARQYVQGVRPEIGGMQMPQVGGWRSSAPPMAGRGLGAMLQTNWQGNALANNQSSAQARMASREAQAMQGIQARINAAPTGGYVRGGGGGITGDAARGMFAGMSDASRWNTSMDYLPRDRGA